MQHRFTNVLFTFYFLKHNVLFALKVKKLTLKYFVFTMIV